MRFDTGDDSECNMSGMEWSYFHINMLARSISNASIGGCSSHKGVGALDMSIGYRVFDSMAKALINNYQQGIY